MELQELRQKISEAGFSEEVARKLDEIMGRAVTSGALSKEDIAKMEELIDIDVEAGNLEADAMESMAVMLDSYVNEAEGLAKATEVEEEKVLGDADMEAKKLETELAAAKVGADQTIVTPAPQWSAPVVTPTPAASIPQTPFPGAQIK
jgi:hypothetical protein